MRAQTVRQHRGPFWNRFQGRRADPRPSPEGAVAPELEPVLSSTSMRFLEVGLAIGAIATAVMIGLIR